MVLTKSGVGAAFLGGVVALLHLSPGYVTARLIAGDGVSLPWLDTTAELIVLAQGLLYAMGSVVSIGGVFVLGYWAGRRLAVRQHYRQFLLAVGFGGLIGYVVPILLLVAYAAVVGAGPLHSEQLGVTAVLFTGRAVGTTIQFAVIGFAGAALAEFTTDTPRPDTTSARPVE